MFNNSADLAGLVMVGQGVDPATSTPDQWQAAADLMTQQKDDGRRPRRTTTRATRARSRTATSR